MAAADPSVTYESLHHEYWSVMRAAAPIIPSIRRIGASFLAALLVIGFVQLRPAGALVGTTVVISDFTASEGSSGATTNFSFSITLNAASSSTVSVDYTTQNGTATATDPLNPSPAVGASDYVRANGTAIFAPGDTTKVVNVTVNGDALNEPNETFFVNLSNPTNVTIADAQGLGTIVNDDAQPALSVGNAGTVPENTAAVMTADFPVTLSEASAQTVTVAYATSDGTATAGSDYTATSGTLTFNPGQKSKTVSVTVLNDNVYEPGTGQTFSLTLSSPTNASIATPGGTGTATITDDEGPPTLSINDVTVTEGNAGTTPATFTITQSGPSDVDTTVGYNTNDGTATSPADYQAVSGTATIAKGTTSTTVSISVVGDTLDEPNEKFTVSLTNPANATLGDASGEATITDDDAGVTISVNDITFAENADGTFTVSLSGISALPVTVAYRTQDGTATAGADYTPKVNTLTFAPGQTSMTVTVTTIDDAIPEPPETYSLILSNPTNATIADDTGVATIISNDGAAPTLTINDVTVTEGNAGTTNATFTVTLTPSSGFPVTVGYRTQDGTAKSPGDYANNVGTLSFAPGDTTKTITVAVVGDTANEPTENFSVILQNASNATLADAEGVGTITNDDATPSLVINDVSVAEGNLLTSNATFTVTLSAASGQTVTVQYATSDGTATAGNDYTATTGQLQFAPGDTSKTINVPIVGDTTDEPDETFVVTLSTPSNATLADATGIGTIRNDDANPGLSVNNPPAVTEGNTGTTTVDFTVSLSASSAKTVTVNYSTADGTATSGDYVPKSGTLTFTPGQTSQNVSVTVNGDTVDENNETFDLVLSNPANATITDGTGTATINDDDGAPTLSVSDAESTEPDTGSSPMVFVVSLLPAATQPVTVSYATANGTATAGSDYTTTAGVLAFAVGETTKTVSVPITGDTSFEPDETLFLRLSNAAGAGISDNEGLGTIRDNDGGSNFVISDASVNEATGSPTIATFVVQRSGAIAQAASVNFTTADNTAVAGSDYTATSGNLAFAPNESQKTIQVSITGDSIDEANETFFVRLSAEANAVIADGSGTGTIVDDDGPPTISVNDVTVSEGAGQAVFTVSLSSASGNLVTVNFATADGSATQPGDYTATSGTADFPAGTTTRFVIVPITQDAVAEAQEAFTLRLSNASAASISDDSGTGTITDDDSASGGGGGGGGGSGGGGGGGTAGNQGYSLVGEDGSLYAFGTAKNFGDMRGTTLAAPVIGVAYTPGGNGYWLVAKDGGIFSFGNADFYGSMGGTKLNAPVIGMAASPTGKGYWLFASDGGIFTFGDAQFFGSMGGTKLNGPVLNMEPLASGNGYWLVASDGGIFSFGQAEFFGSMGGKSLNAPIFDMTSTDSDKGYWLVARDGGIFSFGDAEAKFFGSAVGRDPRPTKVIGMDSTPDSQGYWVADASGKIYEFGNAQILGDRFGANNPAPMVGFASVPA